jgi:hypothetical protein
VAATGEYIAFLNNDARPDARWLQAAVDELVANPDIGCVASKVLTWEGDAIDFVDAALSFYGHGFKLHVGAPNDTSFDVAHDVLFASGAAMVLPKRVFESAGGFDERYVMFFEDVDLGWRLWMLGWRVRFVPQSLVYHRHHASMSQFANWREHYLLERNALFTIFKNYDDTNMPKMLAAAQALAIRRGVALGAVDAHALDLQRGVRGEGDETLTLPKQAVAPMFAIDALVEWMPSLAATRAQLQAARTRPDSELLRTFRLPLIPTSPNFSRGRIHRRGDALDLASARRKVSSSPATTSAAHGRPAIRAWQSVALCASTTSARRRWDASCTTRLRTGRRPHAWPSSKLVRRRSSRATSCTSTVIAASKKIIVVDIYDPSTSSSSAARRRGGAVRPCSLPPCSTAARAGDFLCASDKQRDLARQMARGRISGHLRRRPGDSLIDRAVRCHRRTTVHSGRHRASRHRRDDKVILWGGGIYNWFDPLTLLRALDKLRGRLPNVRVYFLGLKHPNPHVPEMRMAVETRRLADELGLVDTHAFFNEGWVEYSDRQNYLLEAGRRRVHALRPCRDGVLVPHAHPRLPLGVAPDRHDRR